MLTPEDKLASDRAKLQARWQKQDQTDRQEALAALMQHSKGRALLNYWLQLGKAIGVNPFSGNALQTAFNCGELEVGQRMMTEVIEADPEGFLTLLREQANVKSSRAAELAALTERYSRHTEPADPDDSGAGDRG